MQYFTWWRGEGVVKIDGGRGGESGGEWWRGERGVVYSDEGGARRDGGRGRAGDRWKGKQYFSLPHRFWSDFLQIRLDCNYLDGFFLIRIRIADQCWPVLSSAEKCWSVLIRVSTNRMDFNLLQDKCYFFCHIIFSSGAILHWLDNLKIPSPQIQHHHHLHSLHQPLCFLPFFVLYPVFGEQTLSGRTA